MKIGDLVEVPSVRSRNIKALAKRDGGLYCHYCHHPLSMWYKRCVAIEYHADFWWSLEYGDQHPGYYPVFEVFIPDGCKPIEIDHKVPRVLNGSNKLDNLVLSCPECNSAKRHFYSYEEFMAITEALRR